MPPLAVPRSLPHEHQRLRNDPVDSTCSSGAVTSFFGSLWPNRRKLAPLGKNASVFTEQDPCEPACKKVLDPVHICKNGNDSHSWSMRFPRRIESARVQSNLRSEQRNVPCSVPQEFKNCGMSHQEHDTLLNTSCLESSPALESSMAATGLKEQKRKASATVKAIGQSNYKTAEPFVEEESSELTPIMESLKDVVLSTDRRGNSEAVRLDHGKTCRIGGGLINGEHSERDVKVCVEPSSTKRLASFKAGEANGVSGLKKMRLSTGGSEEQRVAADEMLLLCKADPFEQMAVGVQLKVIPTLVSMLKSPHPKHQRTALLALLDLAAGNDVNKAAIVKATALQRMVELLESMNAEVQATVVTLFLSLSALDSNKAEIGDCGSIPLLINLLLKQHTKKDAIRALYNLSIHAGNARAMVEAGCIPHLLHLVSDTDFTDKALATLSNLAGLEAGRHALEEQQELVYVVLINVMRCAETPKLQERAVYVLMMIAHHSPAQREAMAAAGVIPVLVELSLLGSVLAQKRATRTLDSFRRVKAFSGPQQCHCLRAEVHGISREQDVFRMSSKEKVVDGLVKQSLHRTMQRIVRRANISTVVMEAPVPSTVMPVSKSFRKPLDRRSSSCSLPF